MGKILNTKDKKVPEVSLPPASAGKKQVDKMVSPNGKPNKAAPVKGAAPKKKGVV